MCDFGTGNNNKLNWVLEDKQELIDIIETIYRGAKKGRGLVVSPKGTHGFWASSVWILTDDTIQTIPHAIGTRRVTASTLLCANGSWVTTRTGKGPGNGMGAGVATIGLSHGHANEAPLANTTAFMKTDPLFM